MKKPETDWEIIDSEKIDLKHGYSGYPEEHIEIMETKEACNERHVRRHEPLFQGIRRR